MPIERHAGWWLWIDGPVPPGSGGITLGRLVIVRSRAIGPRLLRHELEHVRQWRELGVVRFGARYLAGYVRGRLRGYPHIGAYRRIPLEIEAEWRARRATGDPRTDTLIVDPSGRGLPRRAAPAPEGTARGRTPIALARHRARPR